MGFSKLSINKKKLVETKTLFILIGSPTLSAFLMQAHIQELP
jgi:hypothetical protein